MAKSFNGNPSNPGGRDYVQCEKARLKHWSNPGINPHGAPSMHLKTNSTRFSPSYGSPGSAKKPVYDGRRGASKRGFTNGEI